jgi:hypothetical protein
MLLYVFLYLFYSPCLARVHTLVYIITTRKLSISHEHFRGKLSSWEAIGISEEKFVGKVVADAFFLARTSRCISEEPCPGNCKADRWILCQRRRQLVARVMRCISQKVSHGNCKSWHLERWSNGYMQISHLFILFTLLLLRIYSVSSSCNSSIFISIQSFLSIFSS